MNEVQCALDAEAALVSTVFLAPEKFDEIQPVLGSSAVFYSTAHRCIWRSFEVLMGAGSAVDVVTVTQWLKDQKLLDDVGGSPYIAQILDATPGIANAEEHAKLVREKWRLRQALAHAQVVAANVKAGGTEILDVQTFLEGAEKVFSDLAHQDMRTLLRPLKSILGTVYDQLVASKNRGSAITGTPMGFDRIDKAMSGMQPGDLYVVAGRPGMGKTAFVLNIGYNVAKQGEGVAFFSLEMPAEQLGLRLIAIETKIDGSKLRSAVYLQQHDWTAVAQALADMGSLPFWVDDTAAITVSAIRSRIRKLKSDIAAGRAAGKRLAVVVIDYLQLLGSLGTPESREKEVAKFSRELKALAKEEEIAIVALSQLNRKTETREDKRPQLSDLRECLAGDVCVLEAATGRRSRIEDVWLRGEPISVLALNEKTWKLERVDGAVAVESGVKQVWTLRTRTGRVLRASADHPLRTIDGWKRLADLRPNEEIAVPRVALADSDLLWDQVISVTRGEQEKVYDLVVPEHHNFVASDIIVHNSGAIEQDADAILFLYRPDYYEEDSEFRGTCEAIIAKQRNGPTGTHRLRFTKEHGRFDNLATEEFDEYDPGTPGTPPPANHWQDD